MVFWLVLCLVVVYVFFGLVLVVRCRDCWLGLLVCVGLLCVCVGVFCGLVWWYVGFLG